MRIGRRQSVNNAYENRVTSSLDEDEQKCSHNMSPEESAKQNTSKLRKRTILVGRVSCIITIELAQHLP